MLGRLLTPIAVIAALLTAAPASASAADRAALLVNATATNSPFSPNHDGSKDLGAVRYRLTKAAYVTVRVSRHGTTMLTRSVGRLRAGTHYFVWNGVSRGRVVPDATYAVSVIARRTRHGAPHISSRALTVEGRYRSLGIGSDTGPTSSVVYPRTTVVHDVVLGLYQTLRATRDPSTIRRQVLSASGRVIDSDRLQPCSTSCSRYSWDGRDASGAPVAAGRYRIRLVQGRDPAGNPRVLVAPRTVTVSSQRLVARTTSFSATAAAIIRRDPCAYYGPMDCPSLRGQRSDRFTGGISYRSHEMTLPGSSTPFVASAYDIYFVPVDGRRTPYDVFTVTAHGGPTTAGAGDTGTLSAGGRQDLTGASSPDPVVMHGDTTGTLTDVHSLGMSDPYDGYGGLGYGPVWNVETTAGHQYDVASFDVSYTRYVPAS